MDRQRGHQCPLESVTIAASEVSISQWGGNVYAAAAATKLTLITNVSVESSTEMVVTWVTLQSTGTSIVEYGVKELNKRAKGDEDVFIDSGSEKRMMYIHRVTVTGLHPGQKYCE